MFFPRRRVLGFGLVLALSFAASCKKPGDSAPGTKASGGPGASEPKEIVVGHFASMTGNTAHFGQDTDKAVRLAVDEVNAAGGVLKKQVRVVTLDDRGDSAEAANAVSRLIDVEKAHAILGEVSSSLSLAGGRVAQRRKVPMVSPSSTNPKVTEVGDYIFRVCFLDPFQGKVMATFAEEHPEDRQGRDPEGREERLLDRPGRRIPDGLHGARRHHRRRAVVLGRRYRFQRAAHGDQGRAGSGAVRARLLLGGRRHRAHEGSPGPQGAAHGRRRLGRTRALQDRRRRARRLVFFEPLRARRGDAEGPEVRRRFQEEVRQSSRPVSARSATTPRPCSSPPWSARAASHPDAVRIALGKTKDFEGVSGKITINAKRDAEKSAVVLKIEGGKAKYETTVEP